MAEYFQGKPYPQIIKTYGTDVTDELRITPSKIFQNVPSSLPLRRAIYTRPFTEEPETFWFHMFSTDYEEHESGPGSFPVAILEAEDGEIVVAYAGHVKLID